MEKTIPPCPLAVAGAEEEEINPQNQETWHREKISLRTRSTRKLIKNGGGGELRRRRYSHESRGELREQIDPHRVGG